MTETEIETMNESAVRPNVSYGEVEIATQNEILRTVVGSGVHGIAIEGTDDRDEMGVFIEPVEHVIGTEERMDVATYRTKPEGERSEPHDLDLSLYSLRKYVRLAAKGNPTALLPLYAPEESVLFANGIGRDLRSLREAFLSQQAVHRFLGYMYAQHERMMGRGKRNRVPDRPELVEKYGYDTKYAAHALRLVYQGHDICKFGTLTLPLPEDQRQRVLEVKRGEVRQLAVSQEIVALTQMTRAMLDNQATPLPEHPDWGKIGEFSVGAHLLHWRVNW